MGRPRFDPELRDVLLSLLLLSHTSLGRYSLSNYLGLTKAKTRSILEYLTSQKLTVANKGRSGTSLTSKGRKLVNKLQEYCRLDWNKEWVLLSDDLITGGNETALMFIKSQDVQTSGLYERDIAVRQGARGAITLQNIAGTWGFPNDQNSNPSLTPLEIIDAQITTRYNILSITFGENLGSIYSAISAIALYHLENELRSVFKQLGVIL